MTILQEQGRDRVPELVPIRYGRMLDSPFTFFRGAAAIMAADLVGTPTSGVQVQLCGDAHLSNFGLFGTPERSLIFDVNDFDETLPGPWEWDVKRLAASLEIWGRDRLFGHADRRDVVRSGVRAYRRGIRMAAGMRTLENWYEHLDVHRLLENLRGEVKARRITPKEARSAERRIARARTRDSVRVLARRAGEIDGDLRILPDPPLIVPLEELIRAGTEWDNAEELIKRLLRAYRRTLAREHHPIEEFRYVHTARKVVGVGSVGTRCYIMLLVGRDRNDPLFLQVKEAQRSVLEAYLGASRFVNHGQRVVAGQRLMQASSDIFLGWRRIRGLDGVSRDYYVRQLHDWKGGLDVDRMRLGGAMVYARLCGETLARGHARWGDRVAIASYLGRGDSFDHALATFAERYADQNERDYEALERAVLSGRVLAERGL